MRDFVTNVWREFWHLILMILAKYCINRFFGLSDLRMTKNIYRHTERSEVSINIDPEISGFCVGRSDSADTKEQKVRRTTTKCSEQRLFVKQNSRQFSMTSIVF